MMKKYEMRRTNKKGFREEILQPKSMEVVEEKIRQKDAEDKVLLDSLIE